MALKNTIISLAMGVCFGLSPFVSAQEQDGENSVAAENIEMESSVNIENKDNSIDAITAKKDGLDEKGEDKKPIIVNGDRIEYSQSNNTVTIDGNVEIIKEDSVLTADKAIVNTLTNDAHAEGNVVLTDKQGVIKASSCDYNFKTKSGQAFDATVAYPPYYGAGKIAKKISDKEIEIKNGYLTTCDKQHPHYRIQSRMMQIFPEDKVKTKAMTFRVGNTPLLYMPKYTQNLKDDRMHVQVTPGKSKDWGLFLLTAWRYDLLNNSSGRIHFDYREKRDLAWGVDNYYDTKLVGQGYFKTYYMRERMIPKRIYKWPHTPPPTEKERYRIQWRHKWDVDKNTYWLAEYHKLRDPNFIKDYFYREFEKNIQLSSYILFSHTPPESFAFSVLTQKRTNRIFSETEKLPEIKLERPNTQILDTPFYIDSSSSYTNLNQKFSTIPLPTEKDEANQRVHISNRLSAPLKVAFLDFTPYVGSRETFYQRIIGREVGIFREIWESGIDITSRFYRIFDFDGDILGMSFNRLRHTISPALRYGYVHPPTVSPTKLIQLDGTDALTESNQIGVSLENKLQTKRKNKTVDFLRFIASSDYFFNIEGRKRKWSDNITLDLEMQATDWLRFESDATFNRKKDYFTFANFDLKASGKGVSWGGGYRYERRSSSQMTGEIMFNLIKGWSFKIYERFQFRGNSLVKEQSYAISKDLHCWLLDVNYNVVRERGETIWFTLTLKAFPEFALDYNQYYHDPKPNSQGYQQ